MPRATPNQTAIPTIASCVETDKDFSTTILVLPTGLASSSSNVPDSSSLPIAEAPEYIPIIAIILFAVGIVGTMVYERVRTKNIEESSS